MDVKEYTKYSPYLFVHQPSVSTYYPGRDPPKTFTELLEFSDSDEQYEGLNAFSSIAFTDRPSAQCCVCMQQPFDESLYHCPTCNAPFCKAQCGEKHMLRCIRVK